MIDITTASPATLARIRHALSVPNDTNGTFTESVSAPALSGTFYGDGSQLTGVSTVQVYLTGTGIGSIQPVSGNNIASGNYSSILGGQNNDTKEFANTFILGSNLSATQTDYTYVNNLMSQGVVVSRNGNSNNWNNIYSIVKPLSGNWNSAYATVTSLSSNWSDAYSAVTSLSDNWNTSYDLVSGNTYVRAISGIPNQINVTRSGSDITLSLPTSAVFPGDVVVNGTFIANGSATLINTSNLVVNDNIIYINDGGIGNTLDVGLVSHFRPTGGYYNHTGLIRRAGQNVPGVWTLFSGLTTEPLSASNINWDDATLTVETLSANLIGNVTSVNGDSNQWSNTYTWVKTNSATATFTASISAPSLSGTHYGDGSRLTGINVSNYLPLSGGTLSGNLTAQNISTQNQVQYLSAGVVKVYQYYNPTTNSLDTVFA